MERNLFPSTIDIPGEFTEGNHLIKIVASRPIDSGLEMIDLAGDRQLMERLTPIVESAYEKLESIKMAGKTVSSTIVPLSGRITVTLLSGKVSYDLTISITLQRHYPGTANAMAKEILGAVSKLRA